MRDRRPIRGYGLVWEIKAQVQSLPGKNGNVPLWFPIAVVSIGYFLAVVAVIGVLRHLPLVSLIAGRPPLLIAYVVVPFACAFLLTTLEPHGRSAARHLAAVIAHHVASKERCLGRPMRPGGQAAVLDGVTAIAGTPCGRGLAHGHVDGPAVVEFRDSVHVLPTRRAWRMVAQPRGSSPGWPSTTRVVLEDGERLTIRP